MNAPRGEYRIIRVDGSEELVRQKPTLEVVHRATGCDCIDAIALTRGPAGAETVMIVDDTGMVNGKPVNSKATELYHQFIVSPFSIHGDVAIVNDEDFDMESE